MDLPHIANKPVNDSQCLKWLIVVDGRPVYPAEETEKAEVIDECDIVTSDCDDPSVMVCVFFYFQLCLALTMIFSIDLICSEC